jgi:hypothetical protein
VAVVQRAPKVTWEVRIHEKSAPDLVKSFKKKAQAEAWAADREGEIAKRHFVDCREADNYSLRHLQARPAKERLKGRPADDPDFVQSRMLRDHVVGQIRMSVLQPSATVSYRDEGVKILKGATAQKELVHTAQTPSDCGNAQSPSGAQGQSASQSTLALWLSNLGHRQFCDRRPGAAARCSSCCGSTFTGSGDTSSRLHRPPRTASRASCR